MKKLFILVILIIFSTGCSNKEDVFTIMEKHKNSIVSIQYPVTAIRKIDKSVKQYVNSIYDNFVKDFFQFGLDSELSIDYTYDFYSERYYVITLFTYIYNYAFDRNTSDVFSIVYDKAKNKVLSLSDVVSLEDLSIFIEMVRNKLLADYENEINIQKLDVFLDVLFEKDVYFSIHPNDLTIYFSSNFISDLDDRFFAISFSSSDFYFLEVQ